MNIMNKILVIIESPGKIKKISSLLGDNYIIKASIGHIRDLDKNNLSIDIENNFKPNYLISSDKTKIVKELQDILSKNNKIIIATDNDREGEGIAEGLRQVLKIKEYDRIVFTEITSKAIQNALKNPIKINMNLVNAQEARRILDRLMGYIISPVLWKYLNNDAKSAGRVQSVVNRIIIDKENEITGALSNKYYKTIGYFDKLVSILDNNYINDFLELINKKTEIKICNIENKVSTFEVIKNEHAYKKSSLSNQILTVDDKTFNIMNELEQLKTYLPKKGRVQVILENGQDDMENVRYLRNDG